LAPELALAASGTVAIPAVLLKLFDPLLEVINVLLDFESDTGAVPAIPAAVTSLTLLPVLARFAISTSSSGTAPTILTTNAILARPAILTGCPSSFSGTKAIGVVGAIGTA
jgi:hypothetical protein